MNFRTGRIQTEDFLAEIQADYARTEKGWGVSRLYLELGLYRDQVARYMEQFPRNNLLILFYDDYRSEPARNYAGRMRLSRSPQARGTH